MNFKLLVVAGLLMTLIGCSSLPIQYTPSQNYNDRVKYLVLHFTAGNFEESMNNLMKGHRNVSSHYLIPENHDETYDGDLKIFQLVDESFRAWHAGVSYWDGQENLNDLSIGIELVNTPDCHSHADEVLSLDVKSSEDYSNLYCFYPDYDPDQIKLMISLIKKIQKQYPEIRPKNIIGHSDVAPSRKLDPGPRFPWYQLYKEGIGAWYENDTVMKYWHTFAEEPPSIELVQKALQEYGYNIKLTGKFDDQTEDALIAFQTHFLPWQINGEPDIMTASALLALLEKYHPNKANEMIILYATE